MVTNIKMQQSAVIVVFIYIILYFHSMNLLLCTGNLKCAQHNLLPCLALPLVMS